MTLVGIAAEPGIPLDTIKVVRTGLTIRSSFRYAHVHPAAIQLAAEGLGIVLISSELEEVVGLAHRVLVMRRGRIVAELAGDEISENSILTPAFGETVSV